MYTSNLLHPIFKLMILRSPAMMNIVMKQGMMAVGVSIAAMIGSSMLARSIPFQEPFFYLLTLLTSLAVAKTLRS